MTSITATELTHNILTSRRYVFLQWLIGRQERSSGVPANSKGGSHSFPKLVTDADDLFGAASLIISYRVRFFCVVGQLDVPFRYVTWPCIYSCVHFRSVMLVRSLNDWQFHGIHEYGLDSRERRKNFLLVLDLPYLIVGDDLWWKQHFNYS